MNYINLVVIVGSVVIVSIAAGYVLLALKSSRTLNEMQRSKLEELEKSERRLISLFEHSLAGMFKFNVITFEIIDANYPFRQMLNCNDIPFDLKAGMIFPEKDLTNILTELRINRKISDYEILCSPVGVHPFWTLFSAQTISGENHAHGVLIDINHRKKVEEKNEEQAALLNETQDAIIVLDEQGIVTFWNSSANSLYGLPRSEAVGKSLRELLYQSEKEDYYNQIWNDLRSYKEWYGVQQQYAKDGKTVLVDGHWKLISSMATGRDIILIINTDITEKKKIEDKYLRAQKMETLALLTGGIAHDLQNILVPVSMSIELLKSDLKDEKQLQILNAVEESANSGIKLIETILTLGKGVKTENVLINMNSLLHNIADLFVIGLPGNVQFNNECDCINFSVEGDSGQLKQVFINLLVNARDAMPAGGTITLRGELLKINEYSHLKKSDFGVIEVSDTGVGIKDSDLEKIFDPFFTTKSLKKSTGIGLSIVQNIIKSHNGYIEVESIVDQGSKFRVYLPLA